METEIETVAPQTRRAWGIGRIVVGASVIVGAVNRAAWNRARDVASKALSGQVYAPVGNATHFHTTSPCLLTS